MQLTAPTLQSSHPGESLLTLAAPSNAAAKGGELAASGSFATLLAMAEPPEAGLDQPNSPGLSRLQVEAIPVEHGLSQLGPSQFAPPQSAPAGLLAPEPAPSEPSPPELALSELASSQLTPHLAQGDAFWGAGPAGWPSPADNGVTGKDLPPAGTPLPDPHKQALAIAGTFSSMAPGAETAATIAPTSALADTGAAGAPAAAEPDGVSQSLKADAGRPASAAPLPAELDARRAAAAPALASVVLDQSGLAEGGRDRRRAQPAMAPQRVGAALAARADTALPAAPAPVAGPPLITPPAPAVGPETAQSLADAVMPLVAEGAVPAKPSSAGGPGSDPRAVVDGDLAALVDRLLEGRVQARADRQQMDLPHPDFGRITLALNLQADDRLGIDLPGAPAELRHTLAQALGQGGLALARSDAAGSNGGDQGATSERATSERATSERGPERDGPQRDGGDNHPPRHSARGHSASMPPHGGERSTSGSQRGVLA